MQVLAEKMDPERWQRVKSILADALEQDSPSAQMQFLHHSCLDDASLRKDVEELLIAGSGSFDDCADQIAATIRHEVLIERGTLIGAYEILRVLGSGGMGTVYLAARAEGHFENQVALKVLKRGTDTEELLRRFRSERQILGRLDHPNIARLLDTGTTHDGLPYFVMEYVDGDSMTKWARDHALSIRARLDLFLKVCGAVEFAHRHHVVHRDLKPGNILVQADGEPKLLDFGIAKLVAPGQELLDLTRTVDRRWTAVCASPEQARGESVTPASDVYALGALLYELLTDCAPHRFTTPSPSRDELARVIIEQEPLVPSFACQNSGHQREISGNLDDIVLFAMRKERQRRYQFVTEFADDIRRHLDGRPICARRNTVVYRAGRFIRRNGKEVIYLLLLSVTICSLLALSWRWETRIPNDSARSASTDPMEKIENGIAILPFKDLSEQNLTGYFAEGVQENIIAELSRIGALKVIARTSVASYGGAQIDLREIRRSLSVAHILEGSMQRSGDRLRLNVQLVDTRTGAQVWSRRYDREVTDLFALQGELAQEIVDQLKVALPGLEKAVSAQQPTSDFVAYDLYVQARSMLHSAVGRRNYQANTLAAVELLQKAIARDQNFAIAYSLLAEAHLYLYRFKFDPTPARLGAAKAAGDAAVRIAPTIPESHLTRARYYYYGVRDLAAAELELDAATPALRNDPDLLELSSLVKRRLGHWKVAVLNGERQAELDPRQPAHFFALAESYLGLRRFADADRLADRAIAALAPNAAEVFWRVKSTAAIGRGDLPAARTALENIANPAFDGRILKVRLSLLERQFDDADTQLEQLIHEEPNVPQILFLQGIVARAKGEKERATAAFKASRDLSRTNTETNPNDTNGWLSLGLAEAALGQRDEALASGRHAIALISPSHDSIDIPDAETSLAEIYALTGDRDAALDLLAQLNKAPCGPNFGELKSDPAWDSIRRDPRFDAILTSARTPFDDSSTL